MDRRVPNEPVTHVGGGAAAKTTDGMVDVPGGPVDIGSDAAGANDWPTMFGALASD